LDVNLSHIFAFFLYRKKKEKKRNNTQRHEDWSMKFATTEKEKLEIFHDQKKKKKIHKSYQDVGARLLYAA